MDKIILINSETSPIKEIHQGFRVVEDWEGHNKILKLFEIKNNFYPHPEFPEYATISVIEEQFIISVKEGNKDYPKIYFMLMAQRQLEEMLEIYKK
jgi:hypothetical protein